MYCRFQSCVGSYLDLPRIHFVGNFYANVNTGNNDRCNFLPNYFNPEIDYNFNTNGSNEFYFTNTDITSVDYISSSTYNEDQDPVLSAIIVTNLNHPYAKIVDMDVDMQSKPSIYGMRFGVSWGIDAAGKPDLAFIGTWSAASLGLDFWVKMKCVKGIQGSRPTGSHGTNTVRDVEWINLKNSPALQQLKDAYEKGSRKLSVRVCLGDYTRNYGPLVPYSFNLGNVVGTIGIYHDGEALNVGGDRLMTPDYLQNPDITFGIGDSCQEEGSITKFAPWIGRTPFKLRNDNGKKEVVLDFGNAFPIHKDGTIRNIGDLYIGYRDNTTIDNCIQIIEPDKKVPYLSSGWLNSGSIIVYSLSEDQYSFLLENPLLVIQKIEGSTGESLCGILPSMSKHPETGIVVLQEREYFARPYGYYTDKLEYNGRASEQTLLVTRFGHPVSVNVTILQYSDVVPDADVIPEAGIVPDKNIKESDDSGHVTFKFTVSKPIPYPRQYKKLNCSNYTGNTVPIDSQAYYIVYCVSDPGKSDCTYDPNHSVTEFRFVAYSTITYNDTPYTWVDHVGPIFSQYAHVVPVMKNIVDLSNFTDVTQAHNIGLIKHSMSLDIEDPNYMPVTRDLSPTKMKMILKWLDNPIYSRDQDKPDKITPKVKICHHPSSSEAVSMADTYFIAPRCQIAIPLLSNVEDYDGYFTHIFQPTVGILVGEKKKPRPLHGFLKKVKQHPKAICEIQHLKDQLQLAMQVEFYTIPPYLTALYSIVDGCNQQIYDAIRDVVIQEMMHFAQAANLLLSIGGNPIIDDEKFAPMYPRLGLPGGIMPKLYIELKKLSLQQVHKVFMGIETPAKTCVDRPPDDCEHGEHTIGGFYKELQKCILSLPSDIFLPETVSYQVTWPWDGSQYFGKLIKVDSKVKALLAIQQIIDQGEGATPFNPNSSVHDEYAHFYRFEEIACGKELIYNESDNTYSYTGDRIPFDPQGVWQMRNSPVSSNIVSNTNCYTESVAFHRAYRAFLRKLDETFSPCKSSACPSPQALLMKSIELMESLQIQAKRLMWIRYDPDNPYDMRTCGPVWDYKFSTSVPLE